MQRSSNSNWSTEQIIRARPTFVGQYRQAVIQKEDRLWNAEEIQRDMRIRDHEIALLLLDISELEEALLTNSGRNYERILHQIEILKEKVSRAELLSFKDKQRLDDNMREAAVCEAELMRVRAESGMDFSALDEDEFQMQMAEESKRFLARNLASAQLSAMTNMPMMASEAWLSHLGVQDELIALKDSYLEEVMPALESASTQLLPETSNTLKLPTPTQSARTSKE